MLGVARAPLSQLGTGRPQGREVKRKQEGWLLSAASARHSIRRRPSRRVCHRRGGLLPRGSQHRTASSESLVSSHPSSSHVRHAEKRKDLRDGSEERKSLERRQATAGGLTLLPSCFPWPRAAAASGRSQAFLFGRESTSAPPRLRGHDG